MTALDSQLAWLADNRERVLRFAFILQFVASVPFLWFAVASGRQHVLLLATGANTTGTIISVVPVQMNRGSSTSPWSSTSYEPVVSFSAGDRQFRFQEWKGTRVPPTLGTRVQVIYDPAEPIIAMVDRGYLNYLPWAPCAFIGVFLFFVALKGLLAVLLSKVRSPAP